MRWLGEVSAVNMVVLYAFNFLWSVGNPLINVNTALISYFSMAGMGVWAVSALQWCVNLPVLLQALPRIVRIPAGNDRRLMIGTYVFMGVGFIIFGILVAFSRLQIALMAQVLLLVLFITFSFYQVGNILYLNMLTRALPGNALGRYYAVLGVLMSAGAVIGGALAPWLLGMAGFPANFSMLFIVAGCVFIAATLTLLLSREMPSGTPETAQAAWRPGESLRGLCGPLGRKSTQLLLALTLLIHVGGIPFNFALVYYNHLLPAPLSATWVFLVPYLAQSLLMPALGASMNKLGSARTVAVYALLLLVAVGLLLSGLSWGWIPVFSIFGAYAMFLNMIKVGMVREIVRPGEVFDVLLVSNILGVSFAAAMTTLFSWMITVWNAYALVFIVSGVALAAILPLLRVLHKWHKKEASYEIVTC